MEERNIIARELHDSLAQSLAYLKMQVSRLERVQTIDAAPDARRQIFDELRTGMNSAYRQLRELLTTFRLKLDTPGLNAALNHTVAEFNGRLATSIFLQCDLPPQTLTPNEEIHVLQIVREALTNAVKHAKATEIRVTVRYSAPHVHVSVTDNGVGLPDGKVPEQHYGLIIMHERASSLGGSISLGNRQSGGVEVALSFVPSNSDNVGMAFI
jgi:two-component system, NarL family, nitrate/nitrite sensor histidine kinase NarX